MLDRDYDYSRPLDVHKWSDYPEVNSFVDVIYDTYIHSNNSNSNIKKRHLKVVLLDLYCCWFNDPEMCIGVHMKKEAYADGSVVLKGKSRYNELNIKSSTIDIVHKLRAAKLIGFKKGFAQSADWWARTSRIWAEPLLIKYFEDAAFGELHIGYSDNREVIIMRDEDRNEIDYEPHPHPYAKVVKDYNALLNKTFIDIGDLNIPRIEVGTVKKGKGKGNKKYVNITHHSKFTRRIFNNSSWLQGGRFYGGWWQRIKSTQRKKILINNLATVEIDYSATHPMLAYARKGISYWETFDKDPYEIISVDGIEDKKVARDIVKQLLLLAFNASDEAQLYKAFRSEFNYDLLGEVSFKFPDIVLAKILNDIKLAHPKIADLICTGAGLGLMNLDAKIVEYVIKDFLLNNKPILTVHDSFIVQIGQEDKLDKVMNKAFKHITDLADIKEVKVKYNNNPVMAQIIANRHLDRDYYLDMFRHTVSDPPTCKGYKRRYERHLRFFIKKD